MSSNGHAGGGTKFDFVMKQRDGASAAEVVKRAQASGIKLSVPYVYYCRSVAKKPGKKWAKSGPSMTVAATEHEFLACVLELGITRSTALLARCRTVAKDVASS